MLSQASLSRSWNTWPQVQKTLSQECILILFFDITKCHEKKSFIEKHQVRSISTSWAFFWKFLSRSWNTWAQSAKSYCLKTHFPHCIFIHFFWQNQVSWKEEFCRGTSHTLHPNILGIFFYFLFRSWNI